MANPCLKVDVSTFNKRIRIETLRQVSDNQGGWLEEWVVAHTVWASISQMSQREVYYGMQVTSPATHKFMVRYIPGLTTKHRIDFAGRKFNITSVKNIEEANAYHEILAFEGA